MKIISGILLIISVYLSVKHGWSGITNKKSIEETKMLSDLGINKTKGQIVAILYFTVAIILLFPQTFFIGNLINAIMILVIMALALRTGNYKIALIEIPFLLMPLLLIYLGHPLKK